MPRPDKVRAVEDIKGYFSASSSSFLTEYRSLPVADQQELRSSLRETGARYRVLKMTLTKRALHDLGHVDLDEWLTGPTAVAFVEDDPIPAAKALVAFSRDHEGLVIKAGMLAGQAIGPDQVARLATLDSRDALLATVAGAFNAPLTRAASLMGFLYEERSLDVLAVARKEGRRIRPCPGAAAGASTGRTNGN